MTINKEDLLNSILESVGRIDYGSGNNFYGGTAQFDEAL